MTFAVRPALFYNHINENVTIAKLQAGQNNLIHSAHRQLNKLQIFIQIK